MKEVENSIKTAVKAYIFHCKNECCQESTTRVVKHVCVPVCGPSPDSGPTDTQPDGLSGTMVEIGTPLA